MFFLKKTLTSCDKNQLITRISRLFVSCAKCACTDKSQYLSAPANTHKTKVAFLDVYKLNHLTMTHKQ